MKKFRGIFIKNEHEIELMRVANGMTATILDELVANVRPGVPTIFFDELARKMCRDMGVVPNFLNYCGYPFALCCSVNETIIHGFPSKDIILKEVDIVSFDMGVNYKGFHGDSARTAFCGEVSEEARHLSEVTKRCLELGIAEAHPGNNLYAISAAVQRHAEMEGLHVIRDFVGHGIGASLHEKPEVPNFVPRGGMENGIPGGVPLKPGMVLAIEPMLAIGTHEVEIMSDGWTTKIKDRSLSAHWEHTVVIRPDGAEILSVAENYRP